MTTEMLNRRIAWFSLAALSLCSCQKPRASAAKFFGNDQRSCEMDKVGELPVSKSHGHLYIDATIHNQNVALVFDTGAHDTILTQSIIDRLKLHEQPGGAGKVEGLGGSIPVHDYRVHVTLKGVEGDWERYVLGGNLWPGTATEVAGGLIGPSFFTGHDIDLDLPDHKIILYFPKHDCSSPSAFLRGPLFKVPFEHPAYQKQDSSLTDTKRILSFIEDLVDASPKILVSVNGKEIVAAIDSGAPKNVLLSSGAEKIGLTSTQIAKDKPALAFGIGAAAVPAVEHSIGATDVGDLQILNLPVLVVNQDLSNGVDMVLGLDFLERVHVWLSYSSSSLIMQFPPSASPQPDAPG